MSKTTKITEEDELRLVSRLVAAGVPLDEQEFTAGLLVEQVGDPLAHRIALGGIYIGSQYTQITTYLRITNRSPLPITLCGFQLYLPWKETLACLLPDPADPLAPPLYHFHHERTGGFDKREMLVQSGKTLRRGGSVEGYLMATDIDPLERTLLDRSHVHVQLTIEDQLGQTYTRDLKLVVDKTAGRNPKPRPARRFPRLFDKKKKYPLANEASTPKITKELHEEMRARWGRKSPQTPRRTRGRR